MAGRLQHRNPAEERACLRAEVESLQRERDVLVRDLHTAQTQLAHLKSEATASAGAAEAASAALADLEKAEAEVTRLKLDAQSNQMVGDGLREEVAVVRAALAEREQALQESVQRLGTQSQELEESRRKEEKAVQAAKESDACLQEVKEGARKRAEDARKQQTLSLAEAMAARKEAEQRATSSDAELQRLRATIDSNSAKANRCDVAESECERLQADVVLLREQVQSAEASVRTSNGTASKNADDLLVEKRARAVADEAATTAKSAAESLLERAQTAEKQLADAELAAHSVAEGSKRMAEELEARKGDVERLTKNMASAEISLTESIRLAEAAAGRLDEAHKTIASITEDAEQLRVRVATAEQQAQASAARSTELEVLASRAEEALKAEAVAREEADGLRISLKAATSEIDDFKAQRLALQDELRNAFNKMEEMEAKYADADGQRRAFQGEVRDLKSETLKLRLAADAQLLVIHDKERELTRLQSQLEVRTTEAVERQFRIALAAEHEPSRPQTPKGSCSRPNVNRVPAPSVPAGGKRRPHPPAAAKRPGRVLSAECIATNS